MPQQPMWDPRSDATDSPSGKFGTEGCWKKQPFELKRVSHQSKSLLVLHDLTTGPGIVGKVPYPSQAKTISGRNLAVTVFDFRPSVVAKLSSTSFCSAIA